MDAPHNEIISHNNNTNNNTIQTQVRVSPRILITGASGLVGSNLVELLQPYNILTPSSKYLDLLNYASVERYISLYKPDIVVHLAARVGGLYYNMENNISMYTDNMNMNQNLLKVCDRFGIQRCITCLSTCVFPDAIDLPMSENDLHNGEPHGSNYGYSHAKRQLDVLCELYRRKGREYMAIIPTNIYGKYDNFSLTQGHVIPMLIHKFYLAKKNNVPVTIWGDGSALRQFIYAEDIARVIRNLIFERRPLPPRLILSPSFGSELPIRDVVNKIAGIFNYHNIVYDKSKSNGQMRKTVSNSLLMRWYPSFTFAPLKNGLRLTINWFLKNYENVRK